MSESHKRALLNQKLQKEQTDLLKIQKELNGVLGEINETINSLKVEELQLRASAVAAMSNDGANTSTKSATRKQPMKNAINVLLDNSSATMDNALEFNDEINQQHINLDLALSIGNSTNKVEEEEEDD